MKKNVEKEKPQPLMSEGAGELRVTKSLFLYMQGLGQARSNKIATGKFGAMVESCFKAAGFCAFQTI